MNLVEFVKMAKRATFGIASALRIYELKKIKVLNLRKNNNINNIVHLAETLENLNCDDSEIDQDCISKLKKLKVLSCSSNTKINNVNHLNNTLTELRCGFNCGVNEIGISELKKIEILYCYGNEKINNVSHLSQTLKKINNGRCSTKYEELFDLRKNAINYFVKNVRNIRK